MGRQGRQLQSCHLAKHCIVKSLSDHFHFQAFPGPGIANFHVSSAGRPGRRWTWSNLGAATQNVLCGTSAADRPGERCRGADVGRRHSPCDRSTDQRPVIACRGGGALSSCETQPAWKSAGCGGSSDAPATRRYSGVVSKSVASAAPASLPDVIACSEMLAALRGASTAICRVDSKSGG